MTRILTILLLALLLAASAAQAAQPANYAQLLDQAGVCLRHHNFKEAIPILDKAIRLQPDSIEAYQKRSKALAQLGQHEQATADSNQAFQIYHKKMMAFAAKIGAVGKLGRFENTMPFLNEGVREFPRASWINMYRGRSLCATGHYAAAIEDLSRFIDDSPNSSSAVNPRAIAEASLGQNDKALADLEQNIRLERQGMRFNLERTEKACNYKELYKRLLAVCDQRIEQQPKSAQNYFIRACCYFIVERYADCERDCNRALALDHSFLQALILKADAELQLKEENTARADIEKAIALAPGKEISYEALTNYNFHTGQYEKSIEDLSRMLKKSPNNVAILLTRARVHSELGQQAEAVADFTRVIGLDAHRAEAYISRAEIYQATRQLDLAVKDFAKVIADFPDMAIAGYKGRAACFIAEGDYQKAISDLNYLIDHTPLAKLLLARALCYEKTGKHWLAEDDRMQAKYCQSVTVN